MSKEKRVKFDLASPDEDRKSEIDNDIKKELCLEEHQTLVSTIYKLHWKEDAGQNTTDVVVPVDVPEVYLTNPDSCTYHLVYKSEGVWEKMPCPHPTNNRVRAQLKKVDAFAVVLEMLARHRGPTESMTVGPLGGTFVSGKDSRVTVDIPEGALDTPTEFRFKSTLVDTERYEQYRKLSEDFKGINGFTNILDVSPEIRLKRPAKICLPLDVSKKGDDFDVVFIQWRDDDDVAKMVDGTPERKPDSCYSIDVSMLHSYAAVCIDRKASQKTITDSVEFISGRRNLCNILSFLLYDQRHQMYILLTDCVDFFKVQNAIDLHKHDGMEEIVTSRSRDVVLRNKTRIKISLEGNLTFFEKSVKVDSLLYETHARTNKVTMPVKAAQDNDSLSIIRYSWDKNYVHQVHFFLEQNQVNACTVKETVVQARQTNGNKTVEPPRKNSVTTKPVNSGSSEIQERNIVCVRSTSDPNARRHSLDQRSSKPPNKSVREVMSVDNGSVGRERYCPSSKMASFCGKRRTTVQCSGAWSKASCKSLSASSRNEISPTSGSSDNSVCLPPIGGYNGHPMLTEKSLSALSDSLPQTTWRSVGLELNLTNDCISTIYERSERMRSNPSFELLKEWKSRSCKHQSKLVDDLIAALVELGRNDIAEILETVAKQNRNLKRNDFPGWPCVTEDSVHVRTQSLGLFIYPAEA